MFDIYSMSFGLLAHDWNVKGSLVTILVSCSGETFQKEKKDWAFRSHLMWWYQQTWIPKTESFFGNGSEPTLGTWRKRRFLFVRTLRHLPCSTCQHPKLGDASIDAKGCRSSILASISFYKKTTVVGVWSRNISNTRKSKKTCPKFALEILCVCI